MRTGAVASSGELELQTAGVEFATTGGNNAKRCGCEFAISAGATMRIGGVWKPATEPMTEPMTELMTKSTCETQSDDAA